MIDLNLNPSRKELKFFAIGIIVVFSIVALVIYRKHGSVPVPATIAGVAAVVGIIGYFVPGFIRYVYVPWIIAAYPIGWVVSHVLLGVIFFGVVTPLALIMKLVGRDPMQRAFDPSAKTYWIERPQNQTTNRYFRQF
jgi:hypothetical protein